MKKYLQLALKHKSKILGYGLSMIGFIQAAPQLPLLMTPVHFNWLLFALGCAYGTLDFIKQQLGDDPK